MNIRPLVRQLFPGSPVLLGKTGARLNAELKSRIYQRVWLRVADPLRKCFTDPPTRWH